MQYQIYFDKKVLDNREGFLDKLIYQTHCWCVCKLKISSAAISQILHRYLGLLWYCFAIWFPNYKWSELRDSLVHQTHVRCVLVAQTDLSDSTQLQSSQVVKNYAWYRKCIIKLLTNRKPPKSPHYSVGNIAGEWSWSQAKWRITDRKTLSSSKTYLWSVEETENQRSASSRASSYTFSRD